MLLLILDALSFSLYYSILGIEQDSAKSGWGIEIRTVVLCPALPRKKEISRRKGNQCCQIQKSGEEKGGENSQGF